MSAVCPEIVSTKLLEVLKCRRGLVTWISWTLQRLDLGKSFSIVVARGGT